VNLSAPSGVKNYDAPVEGVFTRDIFIGAGAVDFFHTNAPMSGDSVGRNTSQGIYAYQAGQPVQLCHEMHFDQGVDMDGKKYTVAKKLGYFLVNARPPLIMADLEAFRAIPWHQLIYETGPDQGLTLAQMDEISNNLKKAGSHGA
jgi:hypothetical protein